MKNVSVFFHRDGLEERKGRKEKEEKIRTNVARKINVKRINQRKSCVAEWNRETSQIRE